MNRTALRLAAPLALSCAAAAGCNEPLPPPVDGAIVKSLSVADLMPGLGLVAANLAFDDVDREILILDAQNGVVLLDEEGAVLARYDLSLIGGGFSAIAAVPGTDEVLLTTPEIYLGYRVDLPTMAVVSTFCLEPVGFDVEQHNFALAYDAVADVIYVAPHLVGTTSGELVESSLQSYDGATGALVGYTDLQGMRVDALDVEPGGGPLHLVADGRVWGFAGGGQGGAVQEEANLVELLGVADPASFARDRDTGHHWVLDHAGARALEVR